jgi:hypothetical protein
MSFSALPGFFDRRTIQAMKEQLAPRISGNNEFEAEQLEARANQMPDGKGAEAEILRSHAKALRDRESTNTVSITDVKPTVG